MPNFIKIIFSVFVLTISLSSTLKSQCFQVYDGFGVLQTTPYFIGCGGTDYTVYIQTDIALGSYTIVWGDGTTNSVGSSLIPPAFVQHTYSSTIDTFNLTITDNSTSCVVNGVVVLEEAVNSSVQIPTGGVTVACAPFDMSFINASTNVSSTTVFTWDFGDGSPLLVLGSGNTGQTVTHTYQKNTVNCQTSVTLTAENYCSFGNPTSSSFAPILIYDIDDAIITPSSSVNCYPDTVFHFTNSTSKNCLPQGNVQQRFEYWNFGDYWGLGYDSIISWSPFDPPAQPGHDVAYPGVGVYTIMMIDSNMCGRDTAYINVEIIAPPVAGLIVINDTACVGEVVGFINTSSGGADLFYWDFSDGNGFNPIVGNPTFTFYDTGVFTVTIIASISGVSGGCQDTAQADVYIEPSPVAVFVVDTNQSCDSLLVSISDSSLGAISWNWDFGNGNTSILQNPPPQQYNSTGVFSMSLLVENIRGCSDLEIKPIIIHQSPVANFITSPACQYATAAFIDLSTNPPISPITTWLWGFGDGNSSNSQNATNVYTNTGNYEVTLIVNTAFCSDTISDSIMVETKPTAIFSLSDTVGCSPLVITTINNSVSAVAYSWDYGNGYGSPFSNPTITYTNNDTADTNYTITLIASSTFGCLDTADIQVTIFGVPEASFTNNAIPDCSPLSVDFTNTSILGASFLWDFGDLTPTSFLANPSHTFVNSTLFIANYNVTLVTTDIQGCADTTSQYIMVYPEANFTFSSVPDTGCSPLQVSFFSSVGAVAYLWDFGDGSTSTSPIPLHVFSNLTNNIQNFSVQLIAVSPFGCADTNTEIVTIYPKPHSIFTISDSVGCEPLNVTFTNGSLDAISYLWDFGDGDTSTSNTGLINHIYSNITSTPNTYNASLIAFSSNGCEDTTYQNIIVYPPVEAIFFVDTSGCSPLANTFQNNSIGSSSYLWNFGNGNSSSLQSPTETFFATGQTQVYITTLIATSIFGCSDTSQIDLSVHPSAIASFVVDSIIGCTPLDVIISNSSVDYDSLYWSFGDGDYSNSILPQITHEYINSNSNVAFYSLVLVATTPYGCNDISSVQIEVFPPVIADAIIDSVGCSPFYVQLQNTSIGANNYLWNLGNGVITSIPNPDETYFNNTTVVTNYAISLQSTSPYGCIDTYTNTIVVYPTPLADFSASPIIQTYPMTVVTITNNTIGTWDNNWDFGNGDTSSNPNPPPIDYLNIGDYTIQLIISNPYCGDTTTQLISIIPPAPIADFEGSGSGCIPVTVEFTNTSQYEDEYFWDFGDGNTSIEENPIYTYNYSGTYTVSLTVNGTNGTDTTTKVDLIKVYPYAVSNFDFQPTNVSSAGDKTYFYNFSTDASIFNWDFGDGFSSTEENPVHQYIDVGMFYITLIANNEHNCPDTLESGTPVSVEDKGEVNFPNAFVPKPGGGNGGVYDPNKIDNSVFYPIVKGVEEYHLVIYNRWGELVFETFDVNRGWDGYYKEELSAQDVYMWKVDVIYGGGEQQTYSGDVTLLQ